MLSKWRRDKGQLFLYLDCRELEEKELLKILDEAADQLKPITSKVPVLANIQETVLSTKFMDKLKQLAKEVYIEKVGNTAIVGVTGVKKVLLSSYNYLLGQDMKAFDTEEAALEWLANTPEKSLSD